MTQERSNSPIIIGGIGGSGTRVIAEILMRVGIYLGNKLNESLDNLWFTGLFKRVDWFGWGKKEREAEIKKGLDIFTGTMVGGSAFSDEHYGLVTDYIRNISQDAPIHYEIESYFNNWRHFVEDMIFSQKPSMDDFSEWGWKEPNSHIFLDDLSMYYSDMRYIHVIRHGLDMAYSNNQNQVKLWGVLYGVEHLNGSHGPVSSFRYWVKANQKTISTVKKVLADRFLIINYENLCNSPAKEIKQLIEFLGLSLSNETLDRVTKIPSPPSSIGRYKKHDTSWMTDNDIKSLAMMGYNAKL
jgi:hypothetical protein